MPESTSENTETEELLHQAATGSEEAKVRILATCDARLRRMVEARLDRRLRVRVAVSDVLQEVNLEALKRLPRYVEERPMPFFLWLRFLAAQHLAKLRRTHYGAGARDLRRECQEVEAFPASSADCLAAQFVADETSPTQAADRAERRVLVERALERLEDTDREVLSLRYYEQLSNVEAARELGINPAAASKRYLRALERFGELIGSARSTQDDRP